MVRSLTHSHSPSSPPSRYERPSLPRSRHHRTHRTSTHSHSPIRERRWRRSISPRGKNQTNGNRKSSISSENAYQRRLKRSGGFDNRRPRAPRPTDDRPVNTHTHHKHRANTTTQNQYRNERNGVNNDRKSYSDRFGRRQREQDELKQQQNENIVKEEINLDSTGLLDNNLDNQSADDTIVDATTVRAAGAKLQYHEPVDAADPTERWRLYVFKDKETINTLHLHRQRCYRVGKDKKVCDITLNHPSISKQHAVIQYRRKSSRDAVGALDVCIRPYLIDISSTNGTFINNEKLEPARFYELLEKDVLQFGLSSREYVVLHDRSSSNDSSSSSK